MMRRIFIYSTLFFWLAVMGFWINSLWIPEESLETNRGVTEKRHSLMEIGQHDQRENCWMAIRGAVYDLSAYLPQHPSDPDIVLPWCGKEATEAYNTKTTGRPHSVYADQLLEKYRIGTLSQTP